MSAVSLRIHQEDARAEPERKGFARVPRWVTSQPKLTTRAKVALDAILGFCWGDERSCHPSLEELASAAGLTERTLSRALSELVAEGLINRERDRASYPHPWCITLQFDPRCTKAGQAPPEACPESAPTRQPWRVVTPPVACGHATSGVTPTFKFEQRRLDFDTDGSPPSSLPNLDETFRRVRALWPDVLRGQLFTAIIDFGERWVLEALSRAESRRPRKPDGWPWLIEVARDLKRVWDATPPAERLVAQPGPPAPPAPSPPAPAKPEPETIPPAGDVAEAIAQASGSGMNAKLARAYLRGLEARGLLDPDQKKAAAGQSSKLPPRPLGASDTHHSCPKTEEVQCEPSADAS